MYTNDLPIARKLCQCSEATADEQKWWKNTIFAMETRQITLIKVATVRRAISKLTGCQQVAMFPRQRFLMIKRGFTLSVCGWVSRVHRMYRHAASDTQQSPYLCTWIPLFQRNGRSWTFRVKKNKNMKTKYRGAENNISPTAARAKRKVCS